MKSDGLWLRDTFVAMHDANLCAKETEKNKIKSATHVGRTIAPRVVHTCRRCLSADVVISNPLSGHLPYFWTQEIF